MNVFCIQCHDVLCIFAVHDTVTLSMFNKVLLSKRILCDGYLSSPLRYTLKIQLECITSDILQGNREMRKPVLLIDLNLKLSMHHFECLNLDMHGSEQLLINYMAKLNNL